MPIDMISQGIK